MSMNTEEIERLIAESMSDAEVTAQGGEGKYLVQVVSPAFEGMGAVKRQQAVYKILNPHITSGAIHAVTMDLLTPREVQDRQ